jgi:hypothetical protein
MEERSRIIDIVAANAREFLGCQLEEIPALYIELTKGGRAPEDLKNTFYDADSDMVCEISEGSRERKLCRVRPMVYAKRIISESFSCILSLRPDDETSRGLQEYVLGKVFEWKHGILLSTLDISNMISRGDSQNLRCLRQRGLDFIKNLKERLLQEICDL